MLGQAYGQLAALDQLAHQVCGKLGNALAMQDRLQDQIQVVERMLSGWQMPLGVTVDLEFQFRIRPVAVR